MPILDWYFNITDNKTHAVLVKDNMKHYHCHHYHEKMKKCNKYKYIDYN